MNADGLLLLTVCSYNIYCVEYQEVDVALEVDAAATCELNVEVRTEGYE